MRISSKLKIISTEDVRHQIHIHDLPLSTLKRRIKNYSLKVKKKYTYQTAVVKVKLHPSIIQNKQTITEDFYRIAYDDNEIMNIYVRQEDIDKSIIYKRGKYRLNYIIINDMAFIKVKCSFNQSFYKKTLLPRIKHVRNKGRHAKAQSRNEREDIHTNDFMDADQFPYHYSPNSDGNRSRREVFGGTFSGGSRSSGKRRK